MFAGGIGQCAPGVIAGRLLPLRRPIFVSALDQLRPGAVAAMLAAELLQPLQTAMQAHRACSVHPGPSAAIPVPKLTQLLSLSHFALQASLTQLCRACSMGRALPCVSGALLTASAATDSGRFPLHTSQRLHRPCISETTNLAMFPRLRSSFPMFTLFVREDAVGRALPCVGGAPVMVSASTDAGRFAARTLRRPTRLCNSFRQLCPNHLTAR